MKTIFAALTDKGEPVAIVGFDGYWAIVANSTGRLRRVRIAGLRLADPWDYKGPINAGKLSTERKRILAAQARPRREAIA